MKAIPSAEYLNECFLYDQESGALTWRRRPLNHFLREANCKSWNTRYAGTIIGNVSRYGRVRLNKKNFWIHRVIWKIQYGEDPPREVDHRDLNKCNNAAVNLRAATHAENMRNRHAYANNPIGLKGAYRQKNKWMAKITVLGKSHYLGLYDTPEAAHVAYVAASKLLFGEFANSGEKQ